MKRFEEACILIGGVIIAFGLIAVVLYHEAEQKRIEQERRSEMYKFLEDDNN